MVAKNTKSKFGMIGIAIGSIALLLSLVHFWAGPFSPQPTVETIVSEKISSIRSATINALNGEETTNTYFSKTWTTDTYADVATAVLGGLALILGVIGFANREPKRIAGGAAALGISAVAFQFLAMYAMALLVVLIICAVLSNIGLDL